MAFLRHKHAGIDVNLSERISAEDFAPDDIARYGFQGTVSAVAYDPVQSLLAVGTNYTTLSPGQIHIFGRARVKARFDLPRQTSVKFLRLYDSRVIVVDSRNELSIFDLITGLRVVGWSPPSVVTAFLADPALDYVFLGMQNGETVAFDVDREIVAPFRIPNIWKQYSPKSRILPVVSLALHPRDLGTLLIGYLEGAVVFSIKQNKPILNLLFELSPGAPGADVDPAIIQTLRRPKLSSAQFNPSGSYILTAYEDGCMAFWNTTDGKLLQARTLQDSDVHLPTSQPVWGGSTGTFSVRQPFFKIAWCCKANIDDTSLLVAGGNSMSMPAKGLTVFDLGVAPSGITSSWQVISDHFGSPKRQRVLPTSQDADVVDFCVIPKTSPHFAGSHDPSAVIVLFANGEMATLRYPDGQPISPAGIMHVSLVLTQPRPIKMDVLSINRERWLGMTEVRDKPEPLLRGGAAARRVLRKYLNRSVAYTVHEDATIRLWDLGHNDEVENPDAIEVDVGATLGKHSGVKITALASSSVTAEMAVGLETGELLVYRWNQNKGYRQTMGYDTTAQLSDMSLGPVRDITKRADPRVKEGLLPLTLVDNASGSVRITAVSDVGFVAVGYDSGSIAVIDLRGPAVIYFTDMSSLSKEAKRSSFRKSSQPQQGTDLPTFMVFSVMSLEGEDYSSICLHVGTTAGHVATFKILPDGPRYTVSFAGAFSMEETPLKIIPINVETGSGAYASPSVVAGLRQGQTVSGALVCIARNSARIIRPTSTKITHKTWEDSICVSAAISELQDRGIVLLCIMSSGKIKAYSLPALKEVGLVDVSHLTDKSRISDCQITREGFVILWTSSTEIAVLDIWGTGKKLSDWTTDTLYNPNAPIPARPTISNLQWISGTQYISQVDFDLLIGGPDRPMSRKQAEDQRALALQERETMKAGGSAGPSKTAVNTGGGIFANMSAGIQERTQNLSSWSENMQSLETSSQDFAEATSKFISAQKKKAVLGSIKGFF